MRLDLFLKLSRLSPRRTVAKQMCDDGYVRLNDHLAKASSAVAVGDLLEVTWRHRRRVVKILAIPAGQLSKKIAPTLYQVLQEEIEGSVEVL